MTHKFVKHWSIFLDNKLLLCNTGNHTQYPVINHKKTTWKRTWRRIYMYNRIALLYSRNWYNTVNQLYFNKNNNCAYIELWEPWLISLTGSRLSPFLSWRFNDFILLFPTISSQGLSVSFWLCRGWSRSRFWMWDIQNVGLNMFSPCRALSQICVPFFNRASRLRCQAQGTRGERSKTTYPSPGPRTQSRELTGTL